MASIYYTCTSGSGNGLILTICDLHPVFDNSDRFPVPVGAYVRIVKTPCFKMILIVFLRLYF